MLQKAKKGTVSLKTLETIITGEARILLLIFLSLGFGQIPVIAIFFGLLIAYLSLRMTFGTKAVSMPDAISDKTVPPYFLIKVINQILSFLKFMKRWSRPRFLWASQHGLTRFANGLMIALVGIAFAACPPVPFSGLIAFAAVFLITIGLLNDDGVYIFAGYLFAVIYALIVLFLFQYCSFDQIIEGTKCSANYIFGTKL